MAALARAGTTHTRCDISCRSRRVEWWVQQALPEPYCRTGNLGTDSGYRLHAQLVTSTSGRPEVAYDPQVMRSAWIKWARGLEHQRDLAREMRVFTQSSSYEYVRFDNGDNASDPLVKMYWKLKVTQPFPERWSVLIGDVLTNLRAALDHTFWAAALAATGVPEYPHRVTFPLDSEAKKFRGRKDLKSLVTPQFWELVEDVQPLNTDPPRRAPLESLRWLSNVDKHRAVHVVGRMAFDAGPIILDPDGKYEILEQERVTGEVADTSVVARLKMKRPNKPGSLNVYPTFQYSPSLQVSEDPAEFVPLHVAMDAMSEAVLHVLVASTSLLGEQLPGADTLEVGMGHEAVAAEYAGVVARFHRLDGTVDHVALPKDELEK
ncbi:hypothetical protein [Nocardia sp. XZ_19_369]|uniref:hypothetical protein n=1 Tax=Nocardia sp. XZ_19_369 TaxID=2769487 RepID=UPI00189023EF|nr:hypothetical protein [Nocardia sp. XZ_19_369]